MSAQSEIDRIKNAKQTLAAKLNAMSLDGGGLIGALVGEVNDIPVYDYSGYADNDVTTEETGTESATYNLNAGYYKNDFLLSHPDNGQTGATEQTADITIELTSAGLSENNRIALAINRELVDGEFTYNYSFLGKDLYIEYIPTGSFIDIALCVDDMDSVDLGISEYENCTQKYIGSISDENGANYECYRIENINKGARVYILNG